MNVFLFTSSDIEQGKLVFRDRRLRQLVDVHAAQVGDCVRVGELNGLMGSASIEAINPHEATLSFHCETPSPAKLPLTLIVALPRPKMLRRILRSVAELGVRELILINSYRVEKSYWQSPLLNELKLRHYLCEGLQQARDTVLPELRLVTRFKPFVEDELPGLASDKLKLIAHPARGEACAHQLNEESIVAIGPEGGFTDYEVARFVEAGFSPFHLGPRILRVETAVTAIVSKLF